MQTNLLGKMLYKGDNVIGEIVAVAYDATDEEKPLFVFMVKTNSSNLMMLVLDNTDHSLIMRVL